MTILYVIKYIAQLGGLDRVMAFKMNWLAQHGYKVHLVTYEQRDHSISFPLDPSISHTDIDVKLWKKEGRTVVQRWISYQRLRRLFAKRMRAEVERIQPDVLVTLTDSYQVIDLLMNIPTTALRIVESHVERKAFMKVGDFKGNPVMRWLAGIYDRRMSRYIQRADSLVLLTQQDKAQWSEVKHTVVIPNPLTYIPTRLSTLDNKIVMAAGRLHDQKGFDLLIQAWQTVHDAEPDWQLHIYGDGPNREQLQQQIDANQLSGSVSLLPATNDIFAAYSEASIFCLSSRYEGYGLVLAEAMSCGVPCVSFDCPYGPSDIIRDHQDGLLIPNGDTNALAQGLLSLMQDSKLRHTYGAAARNNIMRYSPDNIMPLWKTLFT
ncbi:MAG: glycosyltransferase family 4 protein [Bacteroidaceae bacterium]|nr:glycosyltransferase family 4 protein [Bacteroidaceae bacterium]